jgi:hypothetical protein
MYLKKSQLFHGSQPQTNRIVYEASGFVYIWLEVSELRLHSLISETNKPICDQVALYFSFRWLPTRWVTS